MAKATAICTCATCGAEFTRQTTKSNRREADAWEEWARKEFTECPACWGKRRAQAERDAGLFAYVRLGSPYDIAPGLWIVCKGPTYEIKDQIKALGGQWRDDYPTADKGAAASLFYGMTGRPPQKRWAILCTEEELPEKVEAIAKLGFAVDFPDPATLAMWQSVHAETKHRQEEKAREKAALEAGVKADQAAALAKLGPKPAWPQEIKDLWPDGSTWNNKFYGKPGRWRVYFSGKEVHLTDEQKEKMEETRRLREEWESRKKEIEVSRK